jgi:hypothetical protein
MPDSVFEIRTALATAVSSISGLRTSAFIPDNPNPPIAVVMPERIEYDLNARRGADTYTFSIMVIVSRSDERSAQRELDAYLIGPRAIKAAVETDRTLGGKVNTTRVTEMRSYSSVVIGETTYMSVQLVCEVIA